MIFLLLQTLVKKLIHFHFYVNLIRENVKSRNKNLLKATLQKNGHDMLSISLWSIFCVLAASRLHRSNLVSWQPHRLARPLPLATPRDRDYILIYTVYK